MNPAQSRSSVHAYQRPSKLYRYSQRQWLERSLQLGEFRLRPPPAEMQMTAPVQQIIPFSARRSVAASTFLTLSMADSWDEKLFDIFGGADTCLVVHDAEQFGERIHRAVQRMLPSWAGIDAAISYGTPSPLGAAFSKARQLALEKEWLFAWRPTQHVMSCSPVVIRIGSIESIAELRVRGA
ncbi:hypothetical protein [Noviherbaspirillum sp. Root189]|uniref:hypothetical protein n=1 Tax=Noviherbaspirillum sp. Root189 TaxID=1736487 RepID=UPI0007093F12|nr:hypothetical protein [Noviherbaspirillum sp. Root189]KRB94110.1 hypothetical protein ASE07_00800 [Noviherbaspirillum sp. Root189]